jgi:hypothetical protein
VKKSPKQNFMTRHFNDLQLRKVEFFTASDLFAWLCVAGLLGVIAWGILRSRQIRRFLEKVIPNQALSPPFEKGGLGGILIGGVNPRGSNPPSPPFAKGGNGNAPFRGQAGKLFSGNRLK